MKSDYIVYGVLAVVFGIVIYTIYTLTSGPAIPATGQNTDSGFQMITSGNIETGNVQIDLTPAGFENGQLKVNFAINTHSVDLSRYDLTKITVLEYSGKKIMPLSAPELQGHHTSGTMVFNVGENIKKFKIIISGIPNVQERVFEWK